MPASIVLRALILLIDNRIIGRAEIILNSKEKGFCSPKLLRDLSVIKTPTQV